MAGFNDMCIWVGNLALLLFTPGLFAGAEIITVGVEREDGDDEVPWDDGRPR